MNTSHWLALGQTAFYGAITAILPVLVGDITGGGIVIPYGLTAVVLYFLNQLENVMAAQGKGNLFGFAN